MMYLCKKASVFFLILLKIVNSIILKKVPKNNFKISQKIPFSVRNALNNSI